MKILAKLCIACGKEFAKPQNESMKNWTNRHKYCSRKCSDAHKKGKPTWNKGVKTGIVPKTAFKKGEFRHPETAFKKGQKAWNKGLDGKKYLSDEARRKMSTWAGKSGVGTPNWRGGTTKLGTCIRSLNVYKEWRTACFERDNRTCVLCGVSGVPLHCDHIKMFYKILRDNDIKTVEQAKQCGELWEIRNGRTLCIPCHRQTPSYLVNERTS